MKFKGIFATALLTLLLKLGSTVCAGEKNKPLDQQGSNPYAKNYDEDFDVLGVMEGFTSTGDYHGFGTNIRTLLKFDENRIGFDIGGSMVNKDEINGLAGNIEAYFARYFNANDVTFYLQGGVGLNGSQLETKNDLDLDDFFVSPKIKVGAYNKDFIFDFTMKVDLGKYSLESKVLNKSDSAFGLDLRSNFRSLSEGSWDIEAGVHFLYKNFDNLWDCIVTELGVGTVYQPKDSEFAVQMAPYIRYERVDNGLVEDEFNLGLQFKGFYKVSGNFMFYAGVCLDSEDELQLVFGVKAKNSNLRKNKGE